MAFPTSRTCKALWVLQKSADSTSWIRRWKDWEYSLPFETSAPLASLGSSLHWEAASSLCPVLPWIPHASSWALMTSSSKAWAVKLCCNASSSASLCLFLLIASKPSCLLPWASPSCHSSGALQRLALLKRNWWHSFTLIGKVLHCTVQRGAPRGADITHLSPFCHPPLFSFFGSLPFPLRPSSVPPLAAPLELESFPFFLFPKPPASPARPPLGLARALRKRSSSRARLAASKPSTSFVRVVWSDLTNSSCLPTVQWLPSETFSNALRRWKRMSHV